MAALHFNQSGSGAPLVILHGLFGSSKNWQSLARQFAESYTVYTVDMRNHGASFHDVDMSYSAMTADVIELLQSLDINACRLIGHSMGGKTAMLVAKSQPNLISKMLIADIAPVSYQHDHLGLIEPIMALELNDLTSRAAVDAALKPAITDQMLRGFLMQNLVRDGDAWRWRVNWSAIKQYMDDLVGFPRDETDWSIDIPTLFLRGSNSDYVESDGITEIQKHFNQASIETLDNAGHWLHAEQPDAFLRSTLQFLR